jgi:hypothetical protein
LHEFNQVVGAIAVFISLIYVAFQIRQNTNALRGRDRAVGPRTLRELVSPAGVG